MWWMPKTPLTSIAHSPLFIKGQLWKYGERCVRIEHVGKMLVEHRNLSLENNRNVSFKRMASMRELQTFLQAQNAVTDQCAN
jgi:hypothetical protein